MSIDNNAKWPAIFELLNPSELEKINTKKLQINFKAGEIIRKQGAPLTHVIVFNSGLAKLYIEGKSKSNIIIRLITPKHIIAGPGIYYDLRHHYSIKAIIDSDTFFISAALIKEIISKNKKFGFAFNRELSKNTLITYERLVNLIQKQMPGRMADLLIYLSQEIYHSRVFKNILSRSDMSEMAGMSKDNINRILKEFEQRGLIRYNDKIDLLNIPSLQSICEKGHY
jgi:CRP/FNR family transcriptional regulator